MPARDDSAKNAAEFLKLWQEQLTRQFTDPDAIHAMLNAMQAFTGAQNQGSAHDASPRRATAASDAEHAAVASRVGQLTERLGKLERAVRKLSNEFSKSRHAVDERIPARVSKAKKPARTKRAGGARHVAKPKPAIQRRKPKVAPPAQRKPTTKKK